MHKLVCITERQPTAKALVLLYVGVPPSITVCLAHYYVILWMQYLGLGLRGTYVWGTNITYWSVPYAPDARVRVDYESCTAVVKLQHNMIFLEIYHNVKLSKSDDHTFWCFGTKCYDMINIYLKKSELYEWPLLANHKVYTLYLSAYLNKPLLIQTDT